MKTILIPTDFSGPAQNAAYYALHLAKALEANLILCHAFTITQLGWPLYEYSTMKESTIKQLVLFADQLKTHFLNDPDTKSAPPPVISCVNEVGTVSDLIPKLIRDHAENMIVSHHLINDMQVPILLIPAETKFSSIKRIAFATDFNNKHIEVIRALTGLAFRYDADLVITNVKDEWVNEEEHHQKEHLFLDKLIAEINYPKFYMRHITDVDIDEGLQLLSYEYKIDMVVMVHEKMSMLDRLLVGSHTRSLAKHIKIPLLIIPENLHPDF
ncbi:universal stress protein [Pedobacter gandavensis]|uniref:universal stress protein n=1 Tax=Pedobacter gandavensis TaxID=2679963 RepID=UPI002930E92C|nr:universal stress protein [Pedobacter gandavensis]